jgi:hypothetical protein
MMPRQIERKHEANALASHSWKHSFLFGTRVLLQHAASPESPEDVCFGIHVFACDQCNCDAHLHHCLQRSRANFCPVTTMIPQAKIENELMQ